LKQKGGIMSGTLGRLKKKKVKPLGQEVYEALRSSILRGELQPDQRLIEEQLAAEMGASRTPVREAIQKLEAEELVTRQPKGGFVVRRMTKKDIEEVFGIRAVLEGYAAFLATKNLNKPSEKMEEILDKYDEALERGDRDAMIKTAGQFHYKLYRATKSTLLLRLIHQLRDYFHRYNLILLGVPGMAEDTSLEHRKMLEAMKGGKAEEVERMVKAHILKNQEVLLNEMKAGRLNG